MVRVSLLPPHLGPHSLHELEHSYRHSGIYCIRMFFIVPNAGNPVAHQSALVAIFQLEFHSTVGSSFDRVTRTRSHPLCCMSSSRFSELSRKTRIHLPVIPASGREQFRQNLYSLLRSTIMADQNTTFKPKEVVGLKKMPPYWYPYTTMTKLRWIGRELLEVVSTEFRDRSMEYYVRQIVPLQRVEEVKLTIVHRGML